MPPSVPVLFATPLRYWFVMETVRFTRLPKTFARSEFILSHISSCVIIPSSAYGISCRTKYLTASTPKFFARSSAYKTFPLDLDILSPPCKSQGCPNMHLGKGSPKAIRKMGQ